MASPNSLLGENEIHKLDLLQNQRNSIVGYQRNLTVHQLLLDLFREKRYIHSGQIGETCLAENINLIRSNIDYIVGSQECVTKSKISEAIKHNSLTTNHTDGEEEKEQEEEEDKERSSFLKDLYSFMEAQGQPILKPPKLGFQDLDLYKLYKAVVKRKGMDYVTRHQMWKEVYMDLGIPTMSTSASYNTRTNYKKYLYLYELEHHPNLNCALSDGQEQGERSSEGEQPESSCNFRFDLKQHIKIESKLHEGQAFYAKILKRQMRDGIPSYYVMYNGWTVSHNEWMPEYALKLLSSEEERNPERLANPPSIRSSKSNYLIEEHLGISTPQTPTSPKASTQTDTEKGVNILPSKGYFSQDDITAANILNSFPNLYGEQTDGDLNHLFIQPAQFDNFGDEKGDKEKDSPKFTKRQIENPISHSSSHQFAHSRIVAPMGKFFSTRSASSKGKAHDILMVLGDNSDLNYPQKRPRFHINLPHFSDHKRSDISRSKNESQLHSNENYFIRKAFLDFKRKEEEMSPAFTQFRGDYTRRKRYDSTMILKMKNSQSEQAKLESTALHTLPPSNGRPNPPPISRNNLSQLATQVMFIISEEQQDKKAILEENSKSISEESLNEEIKPEDATAVSLSAFASLVPSSEIMKIYELSKCKLKEETKFSATVVTPKRNPEVKQKLEYLRNRLLQAIEKHSCTHTSSSNNSDEMDFNTDSHLEAFRRGGSLRKSKDPPPTLIN